MKKRTKIILPFIVLCVAALFLAGDIKGLYHRLFHVPVLLKGSSTVRIDTSVSPDSVRKDFFAVYQSGTGFSCLSRMVTSIEGDDILLYLVTSDGTVTLITDYTRDPHSGRNFVSEPVSEISLGFLDPDGTFVVLQNRECPNIRIRIRFITKTGQVLYF
ncbi:MAG: hypothetical protein ACYS1A_00640 [Planctomycetota bacterium]|jgi:hypothetical protein